MRGTGCTPPGLYFQLLQGEVLCRVRPARTSLSVDVVGVSVDCSSRRMAPALRSSNRESFMRARARDGLSYFYLYLLQLQLLMSLSRHAYHFT